MSETFLNINNNWRSLSQAYVNVQGSWREADVYVNVNGTWKLVSLKRTTVTGGVNFDLFGNLLPHVGGASNIEITLTGTFQASTTSNVALALGTHFAGRKVKIINNALILGKEGAGGPGGHGIKNNNGTGHATNGHGGGAGGTALWINPSHGCKRLELYNTSGGRIYAGGGGGGGGGGSWGQRRNDGDRHQFVGSGGHGGRGAGSGGYAAGGAGGSGRETARGGAGGHGGNYGAAGAGGGRGFSIMQFPKLGSGGAGGTAGIAIHNVGSIALTGYRDTSYIIGRRI
ncbi:hypothetical protein [Spartinivicinus marinus]|nr:hypothetical protein [Spartinivicinus marinus]MCX4025624.1 hypothetical protein [Spartinivicinus marinus]